MDATALHRQNRSASAGAETVWLTHGPPTADAPRDVTDYPAPGRPPAFARRCGTSLGEHRRPADDVGAVVVALSQDSTALGTARRDRHVRCDELRVLRPGHPRLPARALDRADPGTGNRRCGPLRAPSVPSAPTSCHLACVPAGSGSRGRSATCSPERWYRSSRYSPPSVPRTLCPAPCSWWEWPWWVWRV